MTNSHEDRSESTEVEDNFREKSVSQKAQFPEHLLALAVVTQEMQTGQILGILVRFGQFLSDMYRTVKEKFAPVHQQCNHWTILIINKWRENVSQEIQKHGPQPSNTKKFNGFVPLSANAHPTQKGLNAIYAA